MYWRKLQKKLTNYNIKEELEEIMKHKKKSEIKLGKSEIFTEDLYSRPSAGKCPECGGILVTNYGDGISCTFCVDCDYNEYDYE